MGVGVTAPSPSQWCDAYASHRVSVRIAGANWAVAVESTAASR
jgi:hypothetical protein